MRAGWRARDRLAGLPLEPGVAAALARRMPHLCLGFAALLALSWWTLANMPYDQRGHQQPPPQQAPQSDTGSACSGCDCTGCDASGCDASACEVCSACDACSGCDIGGIDCIAVPPGAVSHTFESAADRDRLHRGHPVGRNAWASLGLLVPIAVMFLWRRRK